MAGFGGRPVSAAQAARYMPGGGPLGGIQRTSYSTSLPNASASQMQQIQQMNSRPVPNRPADYGSWSQRDRDRWDRRTAAGDADPFAGWRRDPVSGGGGGGTPPGGGGGAAGPTTNVPVPDIPTDKGGGGVGISKAVDGGGYSVGDGQGVALRSGIGYRTPPSLQALLQGLRY